MFKTASFVTAKTGNNRCGSTMLHLYSGVLLSNKKQSTIDTYSHLHECPGKYLSEKSQSLKASLVAQTVKASAYNVGDLGSIPGLGRSSGEGNGNLLQYSCLENPMD